MHVAGWTTGAGLGGLVSAQEQGGRRHGERCRSWRYLSWSGWLAARSLLCGFDRSWFGLVGGGVGSLIIGRSRTRYGFSNFAERAKSPARSAPPGTASSSRLLLIGIDGDRPSPAPRRRPGGPVGPLGRGWGQIDIADHASFVGLVSGSNLSYQGDEKVSGLFSWPQGFEKFILTPFLPNGTAASRHFRHRGDIRYLDRVIP